MSGQKPSSQSRRTRVAAAPRAVAAPSRALLVIDHARLQGAAWAEFHAASKRLDRTTRELHRHEEIDVPAYTAWLHRTFPLQVTALRELRDEVEAKVRQMRIAQTIARRTGASLKRVWREQKKATAKASEGREDFRGDDESDDGADGAEADERRRTAARREDFLAAPARTVAARDIYRRLVQHLHPDRGGVWSASRQRLWHEVQQAWAAGDGDWLARLEVEWETAHEAIGPNSPLSRLRVAIEELHAARRDLEAKLSAYRAAPPWRFSKNEAKRAALEVRVEADLARDFRALRRQQQHLDATIAAWEEDWTRADTKVRSSRGPRRSYRRPATIRVPRD